MTLWQILLGVWLVGIPATALLLSLMGLGYDERVARLLRTRTAVVSRPRLPRSSCGARIHHAGLRPGRALRRPTARRSLW